MNAAQASGSWVWDEMATEERMETRGPLPSELGMPRTLLFTNSSSYLGIREERVIP